MFSKILQWIIVNVCYAFKNYFITVKVYSHESDTRIKLSGRSNTYLTDFEHRWLFSTFLIFPWYHTSFFLIRDRDQTNIRRLKSRSSNSFARTCELRNKCIQLPDFLFGSFCLFSGSFCFIFNQIYSSLKKLTNEMFWSIQPLPPTHIVILRNGCNFKKNIFNGSLIVNRLYLL